MLHDMIVGADQSAKHSRVDRVGRLLSSLVGQCGRLLRLAYRQACAAGKPHPSPLLKQDRVARLAAIAWKPR